MASPATLLRGAFGLALAGMLLVGAGCGKGEATATGAKSGLNVASSEPTPANGAPAIPLAAGAPGATASGAANGANGANGASAPRPADGACKHAACADNFFVDTAASNDCAAGAPCSVTVKLVALGDFHVNDEYPYRFKADDTPGVDFGGTDALGKGVFSKPAGDWHKDDAKSGAMTVKFTPREKGSKTISGTFKLSVCSVQNCLLEQRQLSVPVVAH
jgi:hypothetical protein